MEQINIRKATLKDIDELLRFEQGVVSAERPFDHTLDDDPIRYYDIMEMIQADHTELVVAEIGSKIVGSGYARIENSKPYLRHRRHAYFGFMFVDPQYRGLGINNKVIDALTRWTIDQKVTEARLDVYFDNVSAIKAYEKAGFKKHMVEMRLGLKGK